MLAKETPAMGCPNQAICASAPKGPDPDIPLITQRLSGVKHKILVLSGKGGVGKSTFTTMLAHAFASNPDSVVGVMDTDICGPSIPKMMGVETETIHVSSTGWEPVWVSENLGVMSVQFMLPNRDDAVIWRGPKKNGLIKQFLKDVEWGEMDFLVVDTPPGTSDEHLSVNSFLKGKRSRRCSSRNDSAGSRSPRRTKGNRLLPKGWHSDPGSCGEYVWLCVSQLQTPVRDLPRDDWRRTTARERHQDSVPWCGTSGSEDRHVV